MTHMLSSNSRSRFKAIVVAISPEGVMGINNELPWCYPKDLKRFKELTIDSTIIMGRRTWESIGCKKLPKRRNIVITSRECAGVETYKSITEALLQTASDQKVWFIGGARIYEEAMNYCDFIDLTLVPDHVDSRKAIRFPEVSKHLYTLESVDEHPYDSRLKVKRYVRNR